MLHSEKSTVHVANLPVGRMSERQLIKLFSPYGPISSIDVDEPVTPPPTAVAASSPPATCEAFVTFLEACDADTAAHAFNNHSLSRSKLDATLTGGFPKDGTILHVRPEHAGGAVKSAANIVHQIERIHDGYKAPLTAVDVGLCAAKLSARERALIDTVALYVVEHGAAFEQALQCREAANPAFNFLRDFSSRGTRPTLTASYHAGHMYYMWRVYSILQGDTLEDWRLQPFQMWEHGPLWTPPPLLCADLHAQDVLLDEEKLAIRALLRSADGTKHSTGEVMVWCVDHASCAPEVVAEIEAVVTESTALTMLYIISDILYNAMYCTRVKLAQRYKAAFAPALPRIFKTLKPHLQADRMFVMDVERVLAAWAAWNVFTSSHLLTLRRNAGLCSL